MIGLLVFVSVMFILVFAGFINEKKLKLPTEIALLIISLIIGIIYIIGSYIINPTKDPRGFPIEYFSDYLVNGVLCFMLFSGACGVTFKKFTRNFKPITLLALLTTGLSTMVFGFIFYGILYVLGFKEFSLIQCLLLGAIVSPTDPIAATSILKNLGLSEDLILIIEGESLFNDGVGIAIFVAISGAITSANHSINAGSFFTTLFREIVGAVVVAVVISYVMLFFFKHTKDRYRQIFISILALSSAYTICMYLDFSSAIAAVVCGIFFASYIEDKYQEDNKEIEAYRDFWEVLDNLLNEILYVIIGVFFVNIFIYTQNNLTYILVAIISVLVSRYIGVYLVTLNIPKLPQNFTKNKFAMFMTWSGLKGGLSLALMIEASDLLSSDAFHTMIISVFAIVIFTTVIQGLTVEKLYKKISS